MSERQASPSLDAEGIVARIRRLQDQISEHEEKISDLVDSAEPPPRLASLMEQAEVDPRFRHLAQLIADWDILVARSRAVTDDDIELLMAIARLVGDLLAVQPEGIDERWLAKLRDYLGEQRAKVS